MSSVFPFHFFIFAQGHFFHCFREKRREREKHQCEKEASIDCFLYTPRLGSVPRMGIVCVHTEDCMSLCPYQGLNLQLRYVPWLVIKSTTFQFWDNILTNWTLLARGRDTCNNRVYTTTMASYFLSTSLWSEAAISNYSTDLHYLEDRIHFAHLISHRLCASC